ncbi:MAG: hypothetical protein ACYS0C_03525 [Planctomycetota bacterium]
MIIKRIIKSDGFRIYFWPIFICYLLFPVLAFALFMPVEPSSLKEDVFVVYGGIVWMSCLWILVVRYRRIKGKSVGKRAKVLLIILTAAWLFSLILDAVKIAHQFSALNN